MADSDSTSDGPASRRVAIYYRTKAQLKRLRRYAQEQGWQVEAEHLERRGSSTALERLLEGDGGAVLLPSLDCLGKDARRVLLALDRFRKAGLGFVSVREGIDTTAPEGWTVLALVEATAKLERSRMRPTGRPKVRVDIARLQDMAERGMSLRQMARLLKVSKSTVERLLKALPQQPPQAMGCGLC
ncbi:MAG: recombinase family protein [Acidobacteriota bacterium]